MIQYFDWRGHSEIVEFFGKKNSWKNASLPLAVLPFFWCVQKDNKLKKNCFQLKKCFIVRVCVTVFPRIHFFWKKSLGFLFSLSSVVYVCLVCVFDAKTLPEKKIREKKEMCNKMKQKMLISLNMTLWCAVWFYALAPRFFLSSYWIPGASVKHSSCPVFLRRHQPPSFPYLARRLTQLFFFPLLFLFPRTLVKYDWNSHHQPHKIQSRFFRKKQQQTKQKTEQHKLI